MVKVGASGGENAAADARRGCWACEMRSGSLGRHGARSGASTVRLGLMKGGSLTPLAADDKGRTEPPARQHQSSIRFVVSHDSFTNILISIRRIFSGIFLFVFLC